MKVEPFKSRLLRNLLRIFFHLLYHRFAWSYDLVAAVVSTGLWKRWVLSVLDFTPGPMVLELGPGPGHLQAALGNKRVIGYGVDASPQMVSLAAKRLEQTEVPARLVIGLAQELPYTSGIFDQVVATFPSEYIFSSQTLANVKRVLRSRGTFVILIQAQVTGSALYHRLAAGLFRITGQTIPLDDLWEIMLIQPFTNADMDAKLLALTLENSLLQVILATKR